MNLICIAGQYLFLSEDEGVQLDNPMPIMKPLHRGVAIPKSLCEHRNSHLSEWRSCIRCIALMRFANPWTLSTTRSTTNIICPKNWRVSMMVWYLPDSPEILRADKFAYIEHCFEQIRQTIQCAGDLTIVPLRPYGEGHIKTYLGEPQVHTCRNWNTFRKWYTERGEKFGNVNGDKT